MTNKEKFIEVMNKYFDAGLTKENFAGFEQYQFPGERVTFCTPCAIFRKGDCDDSFTCEGCADWWEKEWEPKGDKQ